VKKPPKSNQTNTQPTAHKNHQSNHHGADLQSPANAPQQQQQQQQQGGTTIWQSSNLYPQIDYVFFEALPHIGAAIA